MKRPAWLYRLFPYLGRHEAEEKKDQFSRCRRMVRTIPGMFV